MKKLNFANVIQKMESRSAFKVGPFCRKGLSP